MFEEIPRPIKPDVKKEVALEGRPENNIEKKDDVKDRLLGFLEDERVLRHSGAFNIIDFEKIKSEEFFENLNHRSFGRKNDREIRGNKPLLFEKLADYDVLSEDDFAQKDALRRHPLQYEKIKPKPLFNVPASINEAFDLQTIKDKKYYLDYWQLGEKTNWDYKIRAKNGEEIDLRELALVTEIFRNHEGSRDEKGNLNVFDDNKKDFVKLSVDWAKYNIGPMGHVQRGTSIKTPHRFLLTYCPNLLAKKLVNLADFKIVSSQDSGNLMRREFFPRKNSPYLNIGSARYYIGRDYFIINKDKIPVENIKVVELDKKTAGIVEIYDGREILKYTLDLLTPEEKIEKREQIVVEKGQLKAEKITSFLYLTKEETQKRISEWKPTTENQILRKETAEEYAERIRQIGDYGYIQKKTKDFIEQAGVGIHNLSWREQQWLCGAAYKLGRDFPRLLKFSKVYGLAGLRTFLSCELDMENAHRILSIGEKLPQEQAKKIFTKYSEIADLALTSEDEFRAAFRDDKKAFVEIDKIRISQNILSKGKELLARLAVGDLENISEKEVLEKLKEYKTDAILTAGIYESVAKEKNLSPEDIRGVIFEKMTAGELTKEGKIIEAIRKIREEDVAIGGSSFSGAVAEYFGKKPEDLAAAKEILQMAKTIGSNYGDDPEFADKLVESFLDALEKAGDKTVIYSIKKEGLPMAFCRFDLKPDGTKYFGSFNVAPGLRGLAFGYFLLREAIPKEGAGVLLKADCDPKQNISSNYIEKSGFVVTEMIDYSGRPSFHIERDENRHRFFDKKNLIAEYRAKAAGNKLGENNLVLKFKRGTDEFFKTAADLVNDRGFVMTRYLFDGEDAYCAFEKSAN